MIFVLFPIELAGPPADNGGVTWQWQQSNTADLLVGICFVNATTGWAVGYGGSGSTGITIKSTTGGTSWQELTTGTTVRVFDLDFVNENTGWIVGENGMIRKTTDGGTAWYPNTLLDINQSTQNLAVTAELYPNYPNPFNPNTVINYKLSVSNEVELTIYNFLGQHIRTLVHTKQQRGNYQIEWDGRDENGMEVSSGIYLCQLKAGLFVQTRQMVYMK